MLFQQLNLNFIFTFHNVREFQGLFRFIREGKGGCSVPFKKGRGGWSISLRREGGTFRSVTKRNFECFVPFKKKGGDVPLRSRNQRKMFCYNQERRERCFFPFKKGWRDVSFRSRKEGGGWPKNIFSQPWSFYILTIWDLFIYTWLLIQGR